MMISGTFKVVNKTLFMYFSTGETLVHNEDGNYFIRRFPDAAMEYALSSAPLWDLVAHIRHNNPDQP